MPMIDVTIPEGALKPEAEEWVFPTEIPDGQWGGGGGILRLPEIHTMLAGGESDRKAGAGQDDRKVGEERLERQRRAKALEIMEGALDAVQKGSAVD